MSGNNSSSDDAAISDLHRKIEREKAILAASNTMRQATNNTSVSSRIDSQIRDTRRNLQYFEKTLQDLQSRKMGGDMGNMSLNNGGPSPPQHGQSGQHGGGGSGGAAAAAAGRGTAMQPTAYPDPQADDGTYGAPGPGGYSMGGNGLMPPRAPYAPPAPSSGSPKGRPNYSRLGEHSMTEIWNCLAILTTCRRSDQSRNTPPRSPHPAHVVAARIQAQR